MRQRASVLRSRARRAPPGWRLRAILTDGCARDQAPRRLVANEPLEPHGRPQRAAPSSIRSSPERVASADARVTAAHRRGAERRGHERAHWDPHRIPRPWTHDRVDVSPRQRPGDTDARGSHARGEVPRPNRPRSRREQHPPTLPRNDGSRLPAAVERLTGRKVVAFISGNHTDPDIEADVFILDTPL